MYGVNIAIADYAALSGTTPTSAELLWLPGLGVNTATYANAPLACDLKSLSTNVTLTKLMFYYTSV